MQKKIEIVFKFYALELIIVQILLYSKLKNIFEKIQSSFKFT